MNLLDKLYWNNEASRHHLMSPADIASERNTLFRLLEDNTTQLRDAGYYSTAAAMASSPVMKKMLAMGTGVVVRDLLR